MIRALWRMCWVLLGVSTLSSNAQTCYQSTAAVAVGVPTVWTNGNGSRQAILFSETYVLPVLQTDRYGCGFYGSNIYGVHYFAIFILVCNNNQSVNGSSPYFGEPTVVWSANRNSPVGINSTLEFKSDGDLVLKDVDGSLTWSTNTPGQSAVSINLTEQGNLVLSDKSGKTLWQSFDHPTDTLLVGQSLRLGQKLTSSVSSKNLRKSGLYSFSMTLQGLVALLETEPALSYYRSSEHPPYAKTNGSYAVFMNGSLAAFHADGLTMTNLSIPTENGVQHLKLSSDGHLRVYELVQGTTRVTADLLTPLIGDCRYPLVCGEYGICLDGQCSCPQTSTRSGGTPYFKQIVNVHPNRGCFETTQLSCEAVQYQSFMELSDVSYFGFSTDLRNISVDDCREACAKNCSCKAAFFHRSIEGYTSCSFKPHVHSMNVNLQTKYNSTAYLKVQNQLPGRTVKVKRLPVILGSSFGCLILLTGGLFFFIWKKGCPDEEEEEHLDQLPGMPTRFSYDDLKFLTENFNKKLGEGGSGSVFEGTLTDGTKVAVKCLSCSGQIKNSFLAEVRSIGSIHQVNLVRLVGFCADKSHRLLVYEYMGNGSLDRWIFPTSSEIVLEWQQRKKIIIDIAKGLNYLHNECRHKILHLDIKPQNILLDENFNAKVADFGLSKLIERDQSRVVTTMRGTPGYLAPEWLSAVITEKVDVYSFGVVMLETLCGRKVFEISKAEEDKHLFDLLKSKAEAGSLLDLVDDRVNDSELNEAEALNMMKLAAWCLQADYMNRPSMLTVIKVLDGHMDVEEDLDYNFWQHPVKVHREENVSVAATPLLPSVLSGPR